LRSSGKDPALKVTEGGDSWGKGGCAEEGPRPKKRGTSRLRQNDISGQVLGGATGFGERNLTLGHSSRASGPGDEASGGASETEWSRKGHHEF